MSFHGLPNELLAKIIQHVPNLSQLARCNTHLYDIVTPVLYREVSGSEGHDLARFLRTILRCPMLGQRVRRFCTGQGGYVFCLWTWTPVDFQLCEESLVGRISRADTEDYIQGVQYGLWDAICALLIRVLPNLTTLELCPYPYGFRRIMELFPEIATFKERDEETSPADGTVANTLARINRSGSVMPHSCLHNLKHVKAFFDIRNYLNHEAVMRLCCLNTAHIELLGFPPDHEAGFRRDGPPLSTRRMTLSGPRLPTEYVLELLGRFPGLEHFEYFHCDALPKTLGVALSCSKYTLKTLVISPALMYPHSVDGIGSLSEFENLVYLSINACSLFGLSVDPVGSDTYPLVRNICDILPPGLQYFHLGDCTEILFRQLLNFALRRKTVVPSMKHLELVVISTYGVDFGHCAEGRPPLLFPWDAWDDAGAAVDVVSAFQAEGVQTTLRWKWEIG